MAIILLVDDDFDFRKMVRLQLERIGHSVVEAHNGKEAMDQWQKQPIDLVLTDLVMPDQEGLETIQKLSRARPGVKIVAMSAGVRGDSKTPLRIADFLGAKCTLSKPFSHQELADALASVLAGELIPEPPRA
jgi:CheY-like chemotaxis protein